MEYIKLRNFEKYQHYKARHISSWVKLYYNILDDYKLSKYTNEERWIWIGLILLAGKTDNHIPYDFDYITRKISFLTPENTPKMNDLTKQTVLRFIDDNLVYTKSIQCLSLIEENRREENRVDKKRQEEAEIVKEKHLDFVYLSPKEYLELKEALGPAGTEDMIKSLNDYVGSKGKKYKSHYHTILVWARKDGKISKFKEQTPEEIKKLQADLDARARTL